MNQQLAVLSLAVVALFSAASAHAAVPSGVSNIVDASGTVLATPTADPSGTEWHYSLTSAVTTPSVLSLRGGDWAYDGQQRFPTNPVYTTTSMDMIDGDQAPIMTRRAGMYMVDDLGRRWVFIKSNLAADAWDDAWGEETHLLATGVDPTSIPPADTPTPGVFPGNRVSTTRADCNADGDHDVWVEGSENRISSSYSDPRHRATVLIQMNFPGSGSPGPFLCTGAMIEEDVLVTAAHCVVE